MYVAELHGLCTMPTPHGDKNMIITNLLGHRPPMQRAGPTDGVPVPARVHSDLTFPPVKRFIRCLAQLPP